MWFILACVVAVIAFFVLDGNAEGVGYAVKTAAAGEDGTAKL